MNDGHKGEVEERPDRPYARLILTLELVPEWHVTITGVIPNHDVALAVLDQARRYLEAQLRMVQVEKLQAEAQRRAVDAVLLQNLHLKR